MSATRAPILQVPDPGYMQPLGLDVNRNVFVRVLVVPSALSGPRFDMSIVSRVARAAIWPRRVSKTKTSGNVRTRTGPADFSSLRPVGIL